jgi:hypothetical protein
MNAHVKYVAVTTRPKKPNSQKKKTTLLGLVGGGYKTYKKKILKNQCRTFTSSTFTFSTFAICI